MRGPHTSPHYHRPTRHSTATHPPPHPRTTVRGSPANPPLAPVKRGRGVGGEGAKHLNTQPLAQPATALQLTRRLTRGLPSAARPTTATGKSNPAAGSQRRSDARVRAGTPRPSRFGTSRRFSPHSLQPTTSPAPSHSPLDLPHNHNTRLKFPSNHSVADNIGTSAHARNRDPHLRHRNPAAARQRRRLPLRWVLHADGQQRTVPLLRTAALR